MICYLFKKIYFLFAFTVVLNLVISPIALATTSGDQESINRESTFYDPNSCADTATTGTEFSGSNAQIAWCFFTSKGLSKQSAAGIIGNLKAESHISPCLEQTTFHCHKVMVRDGKTGYGIAQFTSKSLQDGLHQMMIDKGYTDRDDVLLVQLEFIYKLLSTNSYYADGWRVLKPGQTPSIYEATKAFMTSYERPADQSESAIRSRSRLSDQIFAQLQNQTCGSVTTTAATTSSASGKKAKILISPGHTGRSDQQYSGPAPGVLDIIYGNTPELQDVWDVAQTVKTKLEAKGYEVLMTKDSAQGGTFQWNRAQQANDNKVDLAFEIHTTPGTFGQSPVSTVWSQFKQGYRLDKNGNKSYVVASDEVIAKSKQYTTKFTTARKEAGENGVVAQYENYYTAQVKPKGNIPLVMLWSEVPWIYNETGASANGLTENQKKIYAEGIVNGVVASVPTSETSDTTDECGGTLNGAAAGDVVKTALNYAWDKRVEIAWTNADGGGRDAAKPEYVEAFDKYNKATYSAGYTDCGKFVATVIRASGIDPKYPVAGAHSVQEPYITSHPEKYEKVLNQGTTKNLQPGDIFISPTHTFLYVGPAGGMGKNIRQASWHTQVPNAPWNMTAPESDYNIYRIKP